MEIIREVLCPPEPQLLDTSVLQNLDWINRLIESEGGEVYWDDHAVARLEERYGKALADDLIDLGTLYKRFEHYGEYPWLICNEAVDEAGILQNEKGERVRQLISFLSGHQDDCAHDSYTGVSLGLLLARGASRPSPLILRALGVARREEVYAVGGPLSFLPDLGDRMLVAHALLANVPAILTTDRRTFWRYRRELRDLGVEVMRPKELLELYAPYWAALEYEFAQRRTESAG